MITILTVCKNSERFLKDTIDSVIHQTYPHIQYIIADGGSTDGTVGLISQYESRISAWYSAPDQGMYFAINKALQLAKGDYILILNSDDQLSSDTIIEKVVGAIEPGRLDYYYGNMLKWKEGNQKKVRLFPAGFSRLLLSTHGTFIPHPCLFISRKIHEQLGGYDESFFYASDYDYILRALSLPGIKGRHLPYYITRFRIHSQSITASGKIESERKKILEKHGFYQVPYPRRLISYYSLWVYYKLINLTHNYRPVQPPG